MCDKRYAYFSSGKHYHNIIIHEQLMWWLLLPLSFVINHFNHEFRVTVSYISYQFISLFKSSKNFHLKILCHSPIQRRIYDSRIIKLLSLPLFCMDVRALLLLSAAPPSGG